MPKTLVDARGKPCPQPVILARKALEAAAIGDSIEVVLDNETSAQNVQRFLEANASNVSMSVDGDEQHVTAHKSGTEASGPVSDTCSCAAPVVCVKSNRMGLGSDELGGVLVQAYINVLDEIQPRPSTIIFYNSGIELALKDSPVLDSLKKLEGDGVRVLVCGTCAKFFGQVDNVAVGTISNMYDIGEALASASHVIYP